MFFDDYYACLLVETASTLSVSPSWESGEKKHARSALNVALEENNPRRRSRDPGGSQPTSPHSLPHCLMTDSSAWAGRPPVGTTRGQGQDPETHHVLWWTPSIQQEPPALYKINYREGYIVQHREYSQYFYNNCKRSVTFKHYESLYCTCNLHNKLLVEWAFPSDNTKAPLFAEKPSANSSQTACPREQ